jgi:L-threonylcarbamoyladenylate synthase
VRVLREGAVDRAALRGVLGDLLEPDPIPGDDPAMAGRGEGPPPGGVA